MQQPILPSGWEDLSWDQLREVHRIMAENNVDISVRNLNIYLYLTNLEIAKGEGEIKDNGDIIYYLTKRSTTKRSFIQRVRHALCSLFYFMFKRDENEEFFSVNVDDLALYLNGCHIDKASKDDNVSAKTRQKVEHKGALDWVDMPVGDKGQGGLTCLPEEETRIGKYDFILPSMLITNITYEQYSNLQKLQQAVWSYTEQVQELQQELTTILTSNQDGTNLKDTQPLVSKAEQAMKEMRKYRMQFLAHALVRKVSDKQGVIISEYKSNIAETQTSYMEQYAPDWLFDILIQHLQSCLGMYKTQFPELFSGGEGGGRDVIPLVSEVETINAIQKWQGYQEQQKVYDTNAVFVFGILNSMTKEAKAIEDANAKMKSHRR